MKKRRGGEEDGCIDLSDVIDASEWLGDSKSRALRAIDCLIHLVRGGVSGRVRKARNLSGEGDD